MTRKVAKFKYANRGASTIRNLDITFNLQAKIINAVTDVYGADCEVACYSGGQPAKGSLEARGNRKRIGSRRHDNGRAADCYIYKSGKKLSGVELAKLAQYWLAMGFGAVGLEMKIGGIHLDEHITPITSRGSMFWFYDYLKQRPEYLEVRKMVLSGMHGQKPEMALPVEEPPNENNETYDDEADEHIPPLSHEEQRIIELVDELSAHDRMSKTQVASFGSVVTSLGGAGLVQTIGDKLHPIVFNSIIVLLVIAAIGAGYAYWERGRYKKKSRLLQKKGLF